MKQYLPSLSVLSFLSIFLHTAPANAQDLDSLMKAAEGPPKPEKVTATFKTTRLVNLQTIEQVKRGELDFRISHRFDDIGGSKGGVHTLYGFDNVADIRFSFDYGITDWWAVGFGRSKGAHQRREILDFNTKMWLLRQNNTNSVPLSVSLVLSSEVTTMASSKDTMATTYFNKNFSHRINYVTQLLLARKFTDNLSILLAPTLVYRNLVHYTDQNALFALGAGLRYKFTRRVGIIVDYQYVFDEMRTQGDGYFPPLGVGIEIETGGHVFHLLFSNNRSLLESQYLTETRDNWLAGQFRFGFNISRIFNIVD
jgi:hypothetical protein